MGRRSVGALENRGCIRIARWDQSRTDWFRQSVSPAMQHGDAFWK